MVILFAIVIFLGILFYVFSTSSTDDIESKDETEFKEVYLRDKDIFNKN